MAVAMNERRAVRPQVERHDQSASATTCPPTDATAPSRAIGRAASPS
jgi:hypothetical protein